MEMQKKLNDLEKKIYSLGEINDTYRKILETDVKLISNVCEAYSKLEERVRELERRYEDDGK